MQISGPGLFGANIFTTQEFNDLHNTLKHSYYENLHPAVTDSDSVILIYGGVQRQ